MWEADIGKRKVADFRNAREHPQQPVAKELATDREQSYQNPPTLFPLLPYPSYNRGVATGEEPVEAGR